MFVPKFGVFVPIVGTFLLKLSKYLLTGGVVRVAARTSSVTVLQAYRFSDSQLTFGV